MYWLSTALGAVGWWLRAVVTYPIYVIGDAWHSLFGGPALRGPKVPWGTRLLDALLTIPGLIWHYTYVSMAAIGSAAQTWPSVMRLRDLAAGLPALAAAGLLVMTFFFLPDFMHSKQELLNSYRDAVKETDVEATKAQDEQTVKNLNEKILLYLRALSQLNPDEEIYRFDIARVYVKLGEVNRGQAIMERLAPRHQAGFVPAHKEQAKNLLAQAPAEIAFNDALGHLEHALSREPDDSEIHWLMARAYFELHRNYRPQANNPWQKSKLKLLEDCETHLVAASKDNPDAAPMLALVRAMQGRTDEAQREISSLTESYRQVLKSKPYDVETRIRLAQAYRNLRDFDAAIQTLQDGHRLKPDPQLNFELSMTYFLAADRLQKDVPNSREQQYAALRMGYAAYPASPYIAARFLQGIVGSKEEAALARASLAQLLETPGIKGEPARGMASFLTGVDAGRRALALEARRHFDDARNVNDDKIPNAVANLALASLQRRTTMLDGNTAAKLTDEALQIWPENPNLQMVRGWNELQKRSFATALSSFQKALPHRTDDPVLHSMLSDAYRGLGQLQNAEKHQELAKIAKAREMETQQSGAQPIIVKGPVPGK